jgi:flagellar hook-associated protein 2
MTAINVSSIASSLTGSSFDWQSFVDTMISYQSVTITSLQAEQSVNNDKVSALQVLEKDLKDLNTAATALNDSTLFTGRTAASSTAGSTWKVSADAGANLGSYTVAVSQLATASKRTGASDIGAALNAASDDVSGITLSSMPTATAIKAGNFTINGAQVSIALTDSLKDVFDKITAATGNAVTASYDHTTDKITLSSASEIVLGATNDSSNFLTATRLGNNGSGTVSSSTSLGAVKTTVPLASARLSKAITAVDGSGNGTFKINGVDIAYNVNSDSLSTIINRINQSSAGVTASYDSVSDRMMLANNSTGDVGFGLSETAGGFLDAVGLSMSSTGASTSRGLNALFSINGGATLSSASNTLTSDVTGIAGLSVSANAEGSQTISVTANTDAMKSAIQSFIDKYNIVQSYIDLQTTISVKSGSVSTSTLSDNREVDAWSRNLRSKAFAAVSGLSGTVSRLADLGIDFSGTSSQLTIKDSSKLTAALQTKPADVQDFFNNSTNGFVGRMKSYLDTLLSSEGTSSGIIGKMEDNLTSQNGGIDKQIATIQARLENQRTQMLTAFQAMQAAQTQSKAMIKTLTDTFKTSSSNN